MGQRKGFKHSEDSKRAIGRGAMGKGRGGFNVKIECPLCGQSMSPANLGKHLVPCRSSRGMYLGGKELSVREMKNLRRVISRYGWTVGAYVRQHHTQEGRCAICLGLPRNGRLSADHCHDTGRARQLLCENCNTGLGSFKDDPRLLRKAAEYLDPYKD